MTMTVIERLASASSDVDAERLRDDSPKLRERVGTALADLLVPPPPLSNVAVAVGVSVLVRGRLPVPVGPPPTPMPKPLSEYVAVAEYVGCATSETVADRPI